MRRDVISRLVFGALPTVLAASLALPLTGCKQLSTMIDGETQKPFPVLIRIEGDPGKPIANVPILYQGKEVKRSSADGSALLELHKPDGANVELTITCPPGTQQAPALKVFVRRVEGEKYTEQRMSCKPALRHIAVSVRADDGPNLPVTYLGQTVAVTDASGAAHFAMLMPPGGPPIKVGIDTSTIPKARPQNPTTLFSVKDEDDIFRFDVKFIVDKKPVRSAPRRTGPTQLH